jgi:hypothetical protein
MHTKKEALCQQLDGHSRRRSLAPGNSMSPISRFGFARSEQYAKCANY